MNECKMNDQQVHTGRNIQTEDKIFGNVLHVAPNDKYWKCGIISVVTSYRRNIPDFEYHPSTGAKNKLLNAITFPFVIVHYMITLARKNHLKIIHIHGSARGSFVRKYIFFLIAKYLYGKKVVLHMHAADFHTFYDRSFPLLKKLIYHYITHVDCVIVLSASWKQYFSETFPTGRFIIIPNIVEAVSSPVSSQVPKNGSLLTFLFLGEIGQRKGIFDLLKVIAEHQDTFRNKCCFKIGGNGEVERLQSIINEHNIGDIVQFLGFVSGDKKTSLLKNSDIYILPSYNEGLPISILEAMAHSMPIISTTVGGIPEIVKDGENGILISPGNYDAMAKAILFFLDQPSFIPLYGQASYHRVAGKHFPAQVLGLLNQVYRTVLNE